MIAPRAVTYTKRLERGRSQTGVHREAAARGARVFTSVDATSLSDSTTVTGGKRRSPTALPIARSFPNKPVGGTTRQATDGGTTTRPEGFVAIVAVAHAVAAARVYDAPRHDELRGDGDRRADSALWSLEHIVDRHAALRGVVSRHLHSSRCCYHRHRRRRCSGAG